MRRGRVSPPCRAGGGPRWGFFRFSRTHEVADAAWTKVGYHPCVITSRPEAEMMLALVASGILPKFVIMTT